MNRYKLVPANKGFWGRFAARMMFQRDDLRRENKRLREALEKITSHRVNHFLTRDDMVASMFNVAKQALEGEQHGPSTD